MTRIVLRRLHLVAALAAFATIAVFWVATAAVEIAGNAPAIATVKIGIAWGLAILVPAIATAGATGFLLGGRSAAPVIAAKRGRMPVIALTGLLVLAPSALFLAARAAAGTFDAIFYAVQGLELAAGALNLTLIGLNMRDGFRMTRKRRRIAPA
jgi:hypothetical protein